MTFFSKTTLFACAAFSAVAFASSAQANTAFNKFPANLPTTYMTTASAQTVAVAEKDLTVTTTRRIKRVVEPLPNLVDQSVSDATDHHTANKKSGYIRMVISSEDHSVAMPTIVDEGAHKAR